MKTDSKYSAKIKDNAENFIRMNEAIRLDEKNSIDIYKTKKKIVDKIIEEES